MALSIYLMAPIVIGSLTFSLQTSLYYDIQAVFLLLIGDVTLILVVSLIVTMTLELSVVEAQKEIDSKVFGSINRESLVVVEE